MTQETQTHQAPPAEDPRPQKVQKTSDAETPVSKPINNSDAPTNGADIPTAPTNGAETPSAPTNGVDASTVPTNGSDPTPTNGTEASTVPTNGTTEKSNNTTTPSTNGDDTTTNITNGTKSKLASVGNDMTTNNNNDLSTVSLRDYVSCHSSTGLNMLDQNALGDSNNSDAINISEEARTAFHKVVESSGTVCILLAAGQGSRFVSDIPKVIHPICGKPLVQHAMDAALQANMPVIIVVGHARDQVARTIVVPESAKDHVVFVSQDERMGTGHAVYIAATSALPKEYDGDIYVAYADNPGIDEELVKEFKQAHEDFKTKHGSDDYAAMSVTGSRKDAGQGANAYGRIVRDKTNKTVIDIVEKKTIVKMIENNEKKIYGNGNGNDDKQEWTGKELDEIDEFNSGIVVACAKPYLDVLGNIKGSMTKKEPQVKYEYYATDFVKGLVQKGKIAEGFQIKGENMWKLEGSNTVEELMELQKKMQSAAAANTTEKGEEEEKKE